MVLDGWAVYLLGAMWPFRGKRVGTPFPLLKICRNAWERRSGTQGKGVPIVNKKAVLSQVISYSTSCIMQIE